MSQNHLAKRLAELASSLLARNNTPAQLTAREIEMQIEKQKADYAIMSQNAQRAALWAYKSQNVYSAVTSTSTASPQRVTLSSTAQVIGIPNNTYPYPGIFTSRLYLCQFEGTQEFIGILGEAILQQLVDWLNDKELMKYSMNRHCDHTVDTQTAYLLDNFGGKALMRTNTPRYWFIYLHDRERTTDANFIGTITTFPTADDGVNIGIMLGREHGHGYGAEAMNGVINWHHKREIAHFEIGTDERNEAMIRLAATCGLKFSSKMNGIVYMRMDLDPPQRHLISDDVWPDKNIEEMDEILDRYTPTVKRITPP